MDGEVLLLHIVALQSIEIEVMTSLNLKLIINIIPSYNYHTYHTLLHITHK